MNIKKALKIREALGTLSVELGIDFGLIPSRITFGDDDKFQLILEAQKTWMEFDALDPVARGAMLGIEVTLANDVTTYSTTL